MSKEYSGLARIYDYLVAGVDFEGWIDYVENLLRHFGHRVTSVADMACGTGNTTFPFTRRGYKTTGVDISGEMLNLARGKAAASGVEVTWLEQDMRKLSLPEKVDLVTCFHDGLNYLLDLEDVRQTFRQVRKNLRQHGVFIFDLNRVTWLSGMPSGTTVVEEDDMTLIWDTGYDTGRDIWRIKLTAFVRKGANYHKFTETHMEKGYRPEEITSCLSDAGLDLLGIFNAFSLEPGDHRSVRHFYVAQRND